MTIDEVNERLKELAEDAYAKRSGGITPGAKPMLGVRIPKLRELAKQIAKENYRSFLEQCPDDLFEQQALQAFVLGYAKDEIDTVLLYADRFIPKIGDWAVSDGFCQTFVIARKHRKRVWEWLMEYAGKKDEFSQRVVAVLLMSHFLTEEYIKPVLDVMNDLDYDGYYTKMGVAWCVATAYAKYPDETNSFLIENRLSDWTYNKAIQKMLESCRIAEEDKAELRKKKRRMQ